MKAWIGTVTVIIGEERKTDQRLEQVEILWPNGNLKEKGFTRDGRKTGRWHYFSEQGDRIRILEFVDGQVCSTKACNPGHPDNRGAGVRAK